MAGAVVDVRGTGGSGGTLEGNFFSPREARDSATVIEYLGNQPYSTGKVGMAGGSYVGITQFLAAQQRPPHLAAIAPQVPISDLYRDGFAHGGIPSLLFDAQYVAVQGAPGLPGEQRSVPARGDARRPSSDSGRRAPPPSTTSSAPTTTRSTATARRSTAPTRSRCRR